MKDLIKVSIVIWILVQKSTVMTMNNHPRADCVEDYFPCSCIMFGDGTIQVDCDQVSVLEVENILNRTTTRDLYRFDWILPADGSVDLPAGFFSNKRAEIIRLASAFPTFTKLSIHPEALSSSRDYTNQFILSDCDLAPLSFDFLIGFQTLKELNIYSSQNIQCLQTLPLLARLAEFDIFDCTGFEKLSSFPTDSLPVLETFKLNSNQLDDRIVGLILDTIAASSGDTLSFLSVNNNQLTRIPDQLASITRLSTFNAANNQINIITSGSLAFTAVNVKAIYLPSNSLETIEPDAFQGNLGQAQITLDNNLLTQFNSAVFKPVLEQMVQQVLGRFYMYSNPVECDCSLAWLIRDNRIMLNFISGGTCSDSTEFSQLDPNDFSNCP